MASHPNMPDPVTARLLEFLVPGLLHGMGNAVFAIQARAQVLGQKGEVDASCEEILTSSRQAAHFLETLRLVSSAEGDDPAMPLQHALTMATEPMRVGMRDAGLRIMHANASGDPNVTVPARRFTRGLVLAVAGTVARLPSGSKGTVELRYDETRRVWVRFVGESSQLPFGVDWAAVAAEVEPVLDPTGGSAQAMANSLVLQFPEPDRG